MHNQISGLDQFSFDERFHSESILRHRHFEGKHNARECAAEFCVAVQPFCNTRFLEKRVGGERGCEIPPSAACDTGLLTTAPTPLTLRCTAGIHFAVDHHRLRHSAAWPFGSSLGHPRASCVT